VLGFAQQEGKGWAYLVVLVAGEGPEEDLAEGSSDLAEELSTWCSRRRESASW